MGGRISSEIHFWAELLLIKPSLAEGRSQLNRKDRCWKTLLLVVIDSIEEGYFMECKANVKSLFVGKIMYFKHNGVLGLLVQYLGLCHDIGTRAGNSFSISQKGWNCLLAFLQQ